MTTGQPATTDQQTPGTETSAVPPPTAVGPRRSWLNPVRPWTRRSVAGAVLVGLAVAGLTWIFRTGIVPTDPWHYVQSARAFPDRDWVPLGYTRYGMILPLIPLLAVFGDVEIVYYVWPLVGAGLLAASLYLLGRRFWGRGAGVLAVVLGLISPITFLNLSRGYPDVLSTGLFGLALVLALVARDTMSRRAVTAGAAEGPGSATVETGRLPVALLASIGFLLGWGFEARETTILTWPVIAVVLLGRRRFLPVLCWLASGIAVWAVADLAIGLFGYGDLLMRVHAFTNQDLADTTNSGDLAARDLLVGRSRLFYLTEVPRLLAADGAAGRWSLVLGVLALLGLARRGATRFTTLVFLVAFVGFVGITGMFFPDHPSGRIDIERYWVSFLPWMGLAAAALVAELAGLLTAWLRDRRFAGLRLRGRGALLLLGLLVALGPAVPLVAVAATNPTMVVNGGNQLAELGGYLAGHEQGRFRLYSDWYTLRLLPIYQRDRFGGPDRWQAELLSLTGRKADPSTGDLVAINSLDTMACPFCNRVVNEWNESRGPVPSDWHEVWASTDRNLVLYRVG